MNSLAGLRRLDGLKGVVLAFVASAPFAGSPAAAQAQRPNCLPEAVAVATTPGSPQSVNGMVRYTALTRMTPPPDVDVLLLGDSIVELWPQPGLGPRSFNFGLRGARTQQSIWLMQALAGKNIRPRSTVILVGTNNLASQDLPCAIAAGVIELVRMVRDTWPEPG